MCTSTVATVSSAPLEQKEDTRYMLHATCYIFNLLAGLPWPKGCVCLSVKSLLYNTTRHTCYTLAKTAKARWGTDKADHFHVIPLSVKTKKVGKGHTFFSLPYFSFFFPSLEVVPVVTWFHGDVSRRLTAVSPVGQMPTEGIKGR